MYEHLNLRAWPFQVTPDPEFAAIWAGRPDTKRQLDHLIWKMQFTPKSALRVLWANFGMGKTHTLMHLQHLCRQNKSGLLIPVYVVMPKSCRRFLDVYQAIIAALPFDLFGDQLVKVGSGWSDSMTLHPMFARTPGVVNAILALRKGEAELRTTARQWLLAQSGLNSRDLRSIGVSYQIKTPEDGIAVLTTLTNLLNYNSTGPSKKLVMMIDEYQRVGELTPRVRQEINAGLHSYFDENPKGIEIILSFSFGQQENVNYLLSSELKSRAEPQNLNLDILSEVEGITFIKDLLAQFRLRDDVRWAYPFSPEAITTLTMQTGKTKALTPRRLIQYANHVLLESQLSRGPGYDGEITPEEVNNILATESLGDIDDT